MSSSEQFLTSAKSLKLQFHSGIQLPLPMEGNTSMQEAHSMSWLPNNDNQETILPGDPSFLPHR